MCPTECLGQRIGIAINLEQRIVAAIGVRLQNAGEGLQVALRMLLPSIARGIVNCGRRREPSERPIVPNIGPDAAGIGLSLGQDRHCRVVTMQALSGKNMRFDQTMKWLQRRGTCSDLIGQCRQADVDALAGIAFALAIERLVLGELLEQDHRQQVWPGKAAWRYMEGSRWLRDLLALATGKLLPHRLDDLPLTRDDLQGLGNVLTKLRQFGGAAAGAIRGSGDNDAFTRQVFRKGLA